MDSAIAYKDLEDMDLLIGRVSASTGLTEQSITEQLLDSNVRMFNFEDNVLISPDDLDELIDGWAENIKTKSKQSLYL